MNTRYGRNVSKEKTVDNRFLKAKSTECEQSESRLAQTKLCDTRMDRSGFEPATSSATPPVKSHSRQSSLTGSLLWLFALLTTLRKNDT